MRKIIIILVVLGFQSCASFDSDLTGISNWKESDVKFINGKFEVTPTSIDTTNQNYNKYKLKHNLLQEFDRKPFKTNKPAYNDEKFNYYIQLELEHKKYLKVKYFKGDKVIASKRVKVKFKKNGYLYIKNKNLAIWGIPYILGGMDINRKRIFVDKENNLVLEVCNFRGGAIFIIGYDGGKTVYRKRMKRIE